MSVTRGDFRSYNFTLVSSSGGIADFLPIDGQTASTTLTFDGTSFTEYFNTGMQMVYQAQSGNTTFQLARVVDPGGVVQTYSYGTGPEAGLLKTIEVPGGQLVTFLYAPGQNTSLLQNVQDWSGRLWTMLYSSQNYLTTYTTPLGCSTQYGYALAGAPVTMVQIIEDPRGFVTSYSYDSSRRPGCQYRMRQRIVSGSNPRRAGKAFHSLGESSEYQRRSGLRCWLQRRSS